MRKGHFDTTGEGRELTMDVYELPVRKSGGPRVDVDAQRYALDAIKWAKAWRRSAWNWRHYAKAAKKNGEDASQRCHRAIQVQTEYAESEHIRADELARSAADAQRDALELRAKIDAMEQSYREARSMWPEGQTHGAWYDLLQAEHTRAAAAEARLAAQQGALESLRAALVIYGEHALSCEVMRMPPPAKCTCGFTAALAAPTGGETETR